MIIIQLTSHKSRDNQYSMISVLKTVPMNLEQRPCWRERPWSKADSRNQQRLQSLWWVWTWPRGRVRLGKREALENTFWDFTWCTISPTSHWFYIQPREEAVSIWLLVQIKCTRLIIPLSQECAQLFCTITTSLLRPGYSSKIFMMEKTRSIFLNRQMWSLELVILQSVTHVSALTALLVMSHLHGGGCREGKAGVRSSELGKHENILNNQNICSREVTFFCFFWTLGHSSLGSWDSPSQQEARVCRVCEIGFVCT